MSGHKDPEHNYLHIKNGEHFIGGIPPASHRQPNTPPHWLPYFNASNCDAVADNAKALGAKFYLPPMTMENIRPVRSTRRSARGGVRDISAHAEGAEIA